MKKLAILFAFIPCLVFGQINDDFESGFPSKWESYSLERWNADTAGAISGEYSLRHIFDNTDAGTDYIGYEIKNLHPDEGTTNWSFKIKYGYNPSLSNNWSVWLMSESSPYTLIDYPDDQRGFMLGVNLTGSDDTLRLWRVEGGTKSMIVNSGINWEKNVGTKSVASIFIERDINGVWSLAVDTAGGIVNSRGEGGEISKDGWLIVEYNYTKTGDMLLWIDDITVDGLFYADTIPPEIVKVTPIGKNSLVIRFSEPIDKENLLETSFGISDNENLVESIIFLTPETVELSFTKNFINKTVNTLSVGNLKDVAGNQAAAIQFGFIPVWAETADVIITEIMADPSPPVSLPESEYIELYNTSEYDLDLKGWSLYVNKNSVTIPDMVLKSGKFALLCHINDMAKFSLLGEVIGLNSFPSVPNDEGTIILKDEKGNLIHGFTYSSEQYGSNLKVSGGWSLEMIDICYPFYAENWEASISATGGTPGSANSVSNDNPDITFTGLINVFPIDDRRILINFSEPVIDIGLSGYIECNDLTLIALEPADSLLRSYVAVAQQKMETGKIYTLQLSNMLTDFAGNATVRSEFTFGIPIKVIRNDMVFNELLFNPYNDEPDFLEFFNLSDHPLDVSRLKLASIDTEDGDTSTVVSLYPSQMSLMPGSYFVVTTNPAKVINRYPESEPNYIFKVLSLPSMPDKEGHLLLLSDNLELIDEVIYTDKMHFSLLAETEGISLEKIRPELHSYESASWHSAAESSGFGTPGKINSVYFRGAGNQKETVIFSSHRITPDNDGFEDLLEISFSLPTVDNVVSISIYSETGRFVQSLANNVTMEEGATLYWDGTMANGQIATNGIYIIYIEILSGNGHRAEVKKTCTVIRNR